MTDHADYARAIEPWAKKAERERKVLNHVVYRGGHCEVIMVSRRDAMSMAASAQECLWK